MDTAYDPAFESRRLDQLTEQFLTGLDVNGTIVFRCTRDEFPSTSATWFFADGVYQQMLESGFRVLMMRLLEDLVWYRVHCGLEYAYDCCVTLSASRALIRWLEQGEGDALAARMRAEEAGA